MTLCLLWHESRIKSGDDPVTKLYQVCLVLLVHRFYTVIGTKRGPSGSPPLACFWVFHHVLTGLGAFPRTLTRLCRISAARLYQSGCYAVSTRLRSGPDILAGRFVFANSDRGEISHHHLTIVDLSVGVAWPSQGMVG